MRGSIRKPRHPSYFTLNAPQIERQGLSNGLNPAENIGQGPYTAHKKTRRFRRDEGGRFGLRITSLKHKTVIVCEAPHICPLVERISCLRTAGRQIRTLEQAMLVLAIEYSKLLLLLLLIGTVVTLSRFESRKQSSPLP
jgi:hypothetical protein